MYILFLKNLHPPHLHLFMAGLLFYGVFTLYVLLVAGPLRCILQTNFLVYMFPPRFFFHHNDFN